MPYRFLYFFLFLLLLHLLISHVCTQTCPPIPRLLAIRTLPYVELKEMRQKLSQILSHLIACGDFQLAKFLALTHMSMCTYMYDMTCITLPNPSLPPSLPSSLHIPMVTPSQSNTIYPSTTITDTTLALSNETLVVIK